MKKSKEGRSLKRKKGLINHSADNGIDNDIDNYLGQKEDVDEHVELV